MKTSVNVDRLQYLKPDTPTLPRGWLCGFEVSTLYTAAMALGEGEAILEVGSWIGKSTCAIAYAVRDAQPKKVRFDVVDYGITGFDEWEWRFGSNIFKQKEAVHMCEVVFSQGGTVARLKQNLVDRGLNKYQSLIILGDIADYDTNTRYSMIFCDATHDIAEIEKNIPLIRRLLTEDFILICDDIVTDEQHDLVAGMVGSECSYMTGEVDKYSKFGIFTRGRFAGFLG